MNKHPLHTQLTILILTAGIMLRLRAYFAGRSLWFDEAMLAINIAERDFSGLLQVLDYNQGAPIGFLWAEKLLIVLFGNRDYILRLFPLAAGIVSLFLFHKLCVQLFGRFSPFPLACFAFAERLIYYSSEVKQYSVDVAFALGLLVAFQSILAENSGRKELAHFTAIGAVGVWFSHPAVFICAAAGLVLAGRAVIRKEWETFGLFAVIGVGWGINFGLLYAISLRFLVGNQAFVDYWGVAFMPFPPWTEPDWFITTSKLLMVQLLRIDTIPGILAVLIGIPAFLLKKPAPGIALIGTLGLVLAASAANLYPIKGRMMLFSIPIFILFASESFCLIYSWCLRVNVSLARLVTAAAILAAFFSPTASAVRNFLKPDLGEHTRPVLQYLRENRLPMDVIYVYYGATPAVRYYAAEFGFNDADFSYGTPYRGNPELYKEAIAALPVSERTWVILAHNCPGCAVDEHKVILDYLDENGLRLDIFQSSGAALFLYDLRSQP